MQEKKNIRLLILLVALITATVLAALMRDDGTTIDIDKSMFRVADLKAIDEVKLITPKSAIRVQYNGTLWRVNDKYDADRAMISVLFATLQQVEPKCPVSKAKRDSIVQAVRASGVQVSLMAAGNVAKTFYVGGNETKTQAFFVPEDGSDAYVAIIPGYRVYSAGIFELDESGWRDKRAFAFNWRNFKELTATFSQQPQWDFRAAYKDDIFGVDGLTQTDTIKLNNFMNGLMQLQADRFVVPGSNRAYDSLLKTKPVAIVRIKNVSDREFPLAIYPPLKGDAMVLGTNALNETMLFRKEFIAPLVRGKEYYQKRP